MSRVTFTACPKCQANGRDRTGDNLAVYPDGGTYCFSCGYSTGKSKAFRSINKEKKIYSLPNDCTWEMPIQIQNWLYKYLTREEVIKYRISYSPFWNQVIIPIGLNAFISRNFDKDKPKWYFRGDKPQDYILRTGSSDVLVLCEDIISGIKIHRAGYNVHVLFGTNIPIEGSRKLYNQFSKIRVWLDLDAQRKSLRSVLRLQQFFKDVGTISTQHDPKEYSTLEIQQIVNQHIL